MNIYESFYHAPKPEGIERKKAFIVGGGMAGLSTAAFLVDDAGMPGENITILERAQVVGGSMDASLGPGGFLCRGERELEPYMECLWYLCSKIPSLESPGRTVLDETVDSNKDDPIHSECRVLVKRGHRYSRINDFRMSPRLQARMQELFAVPEEEIEDLSIEEFFGRDAAEFFKTSLWICFHSMLAFKPYHSAIEARRYWQRFGLANRIDYLEGIIHTRRNEHDSIIRPLAAWLGGKGVRTRTGVSVFDLDLDAACTTVRAIKFRESGRESSIEVRPGDLVFVTNGSMTANSSFGDNKTLALTDRSTADRGLFTLWENLAARHPKFGNPAKFISDIDKSKWMSFFLTVKDYPEFFQRLERLTGSRPGTGGAMTLLDSGWGISLVVYDRNYYPDQGDRDVLWADGLFGENPGDYIRKPMAECTGEEILLELLYHLDLLEMKEGVLSHTHVSTCMMPYITSQFMPRRITDRPRVVPEGSVNLAFIGQYVELPDDVVFTVETSVRTPLEAVYALTRLDKKVVEVYPARYDVRYLVERAKKYAGVTGTFTAGDLPRPSLRSLLGLRKRILDALNKVPPYYIMYPGRDKSVALKVSVLDPQYPLDTEACDWRWWNGGARPRRHQGEVAPRAGSSAFSSAPKVRISGNSSGSSLPGRYTT